MIKKAVRSGTECKVETLWESESLKRLVAAVEFIV